ncbi:MAG: hypothetical protein V3V31_12445 [Methylococcales bacterium]
MKSKFHKKSLTTSLGIAIVSTLSGTAIADATKNPFAISDLDRGYMTVSQAGMSNSEETNSEKPKRAKHVQRSVNNRITTQKSDMEGKSGGMKMDGGMMKKMDGQCGGMMKKMKKMKGMMDKKDMGSMDGMKSMDNMNGDMKQGNKGNGKNQQGGKGMDMAGGMDKNNSKAGGSMDMKGTEGNCGVMNN